MSYRELIDGVKEHTALASRDDAEATALAVFRALFRRVLPADRRVVKALLPIELAPLFDEAGASEGDVDAIVEEIAAAEGIAPGFGREHLVAVAQAAAASLHPDAVTALRAHLPDDLAALFAERPAGRAGHPTPHASPRAGRRIAEARDGHRHLAEARPGSEHPLSESHPGPHSDSVAATDEPHADTKISSAEGMTQIREHESLADGKE